MQDSFDAALWQEHDLVLAAVSSQRLATTATRLHRLPPLAGRALTRLLTCTALLRYVQPRVGTLSLQLSCSGRIRQMFADIDATGGLRGYLRAVPPLAAGQPELPLAEALPGGTLSVIRARTAEQFNQSSVALVSGEIDDDVAHFCTASEQVPTLLRCAEPAEHGSGGLMVQCLPQADTAMFAELRQRLTRPWLEAAMLAAPGRPAQWLQALAPAARPLASQPLQWRCACSAARARVAVRMLGRAELESMVAAGERAKTTCDFCTRTYVLEVAQLRELLTTELLN